MVVSRIWDGETFCLLSREPSRHFLRRAMQVEKLVKQGSRKSVIFQAFDVSGISDLALGVAAISASVAETTGVVSVGAVHTLNTAASRASRRLSCRCAPGAAPTAPVLRRTSENHGVGPMSNRRLSSSGAA